MHSSYSETVGQILPEGIERQLRSQLRALRFEHPQEYARLQQLEVGKFLASKSLHNWLSEWELSRWDSERKNNNELLCFNLNNNRNNLWQRRQQRNFKSDVAVQCGVIEEEPENNVVNNNNNEEFYYNNNKNNIANNQNFNNFNNNNNVYNNYRLPTFQQKHYWNSFPSQMDASTNTATTTEETTGTGGTMKVYRRASYLEEYAMNRVRQLEEERLAKEKIFKDNNKKIKCCGIKCWKKLGCFCCCLGCSRKKKKSTGNNSNPTTATSTISCNNTNSIPSKNQNSSKTSTCSMQNIEQLSTSLNGRKRNLRNKLEKYEGTINNSNKPVVVKFTLSRSGGYRNEGMRSFDRDETNNFEGMKNSLQYCKNNGWGRGAITTTQSPLNYDNVTEEMLWTSMPGKRSDWW
uniref:Uncharacterized protein n=1 Tax=Meloidogyne enterolobii TaxID=390850 RepID=A0A6V7U8R2_MELEN|nr:unnamed protein product [Meloidogyne enterolobii]